MIRRFVTGDMFWAKMPEFPYWPCIVEPIAPGAFITVEENNKIRVHVRFFADINRSGWILKEDLLPYKGKDDFEKRQQSFLSEYDTKHPNYDDFYISKSRELQWNQAVKEADLVFTEVREKRYEKFIKILEESCKKQQPEDGKVTSRRSYETKTMTSKEVINHTSMTRRSTRRRENAENNDTFEDFYDLIKSYVMMQRKNEAVEKILYENVRDIWMLRNGTQNGAQGTSSNSATAIKKMNIRQLASKIRRLNQTPEPLSSNNGNH